MSDTLPDLGSYFDQYIDAGVEDPADLAAKVLASAPREVIEAHALHFLKLAARERIGKRKSRNPVIHGAVAYARVMNGRPAIAAGAGKRARQRDQFAADRARWLADTVWTGDRRVSLGEATALDLRMAADAMRTQAARSVATAVRYDEIAVAVADAGVDTVADLPEEQLRALMDRA